MSGYTARHLGRREFLSLMLGSTAIAVWGRETAAKAATSGAEKYVSDIADQVMALANSGDRGKSLRGKFAALLSRYISLRQIANYALGTYLPKLPAGKKDEFYGLVSNYAAALFVYYVDDFKGSTLDIMSSAASGKFIVIQSAIKQKSGGREQVRWRVLPGDSGFKVSDVNIKGIWLTISMKDRFNKILKSSKGDFEALFADLREAETW